MINQKFNGWLVDQNSCFPVAVTKEQDGECSSVIAVAENGRVLAYYRKEASQEHPFSEVSGNL